MSPAIVWSRLPSVGRDLVAARGVGQIDPGAIGEAQRGPLPRLGQEVAPLGDRPIPAPSLRLRAGCLDFMCLF
jgi:hypothetical protein